MRDCSRLRSLSARRDASGCAQDQGLRPIPNFFASAAPCCAGGAPHRVLHPKQTPSRAGMRNEIKAFKGSAFLLSIIIHTSSLAVSSGIIAQARDHFARLCVVARFCWRTAGSRILIFTSGRPARQGGRFQSLHARTQATVDGVLFRKSAPRLRIASASTQRRDLNEQHAACILILHGFIGYRSLRAATPIHELQMSRGSHPRLACTRTPPARRFDMRAGQTQKSPALDPSVDNNSRAVLDDVSVTASAGSTFACVEDPT